MDTKNNYHIHLKMLLTKDWIHFLCEGEQIPTELTVALSTRKNFREGSIRDNSRQTISMLRTTSVTNTYSRGSFQDYFKISVKMYLKRLKTAKVFAQH